MYLLIIRFMRRFGEIARLVVKTTPSAFTSVIYEKNCTRQLPMLPLPSDPSGKSDTVLKYKQKNKSQQSDPLRLLLPPLTRYLCSVTRSSAFFKSWIAVSQLILKVSIHGQWSGWRASILHPGWPDHKDTNTLPQPGAAVPCSRENQACPSSLTSTVFGGWSIRFSRMPSSALRSGLAALGAVRSPVPPPFLFSLEDG